jgi:4'-phosphopantetheinyl transferase
LLLHFNASHSHGYAAFAFARRAEVGIDIEKIREEVAGEEIAARFFSEQEIAELATLPGETRPKGFFRCWTRKEAYIKARGEGLQIPLRSFCVSVTSDEPQELALGDSSTWVVYSFEPAAGFVGAVAIGDKKWRVRYLDWQPKLELRQRI